MRPKKRRFFTVGRGPVPRHATIAGETLSDARMASEGPRATGKSRPGGLSYRQFPVFPLMSKNAAKCVSTPPKLGRGLTLSRGRGC